MKTINKIILFCLVLSISPALFAEQIAKQCFSGYLDSKARFIDENKFDKFDFSGIIADTSTKFLGYIGADYHRLHINFNSVKKVSKTRYIVSGEYKITTEACPFDGEIQIIKIKKYVNLNYGVDDFMKGKINAQGIALASYILKGDGGFQAKGQMLMKWYINSDQRLAYDDISEDEDMYANDLFCGEQNHARGGITGYQTAAILMWELGNLAPIQNILTTAGATLTRMNKFSIKRFLMLSLILSFLNLAASENLPHITSIDDIKIGKKLSLKNVKYFLDREKAIFVNLDKNQIMTLDFCCGGNGEIQRINVKFYDKNLTKDYINFSKLKEFTTNSGIKLGDKQEQILKKLGKPNDLLEENDTTTVTYTTKQSKSRLLQEFDMSLYYEKFVFYGGVLKEYEFGFEYP